MIGCIDCFERKVKDRIQELEPIKKEFPFADAAREILGLELVLRLIKKYNK